MASDRGDPGTSSESGDEEPSTKRPRTFEVGQDPATPEKVAYLGYLESPLPKVTLVEVDDSSSNREGRSPNEVKPVRMTGFFQRALSVAPHIMMALPGPNLCGTPVTSEMDSNTYFHTYVLNPINLVLQQWQGDPFFNRWRFVQNPNKFRGKGESPNAKWWHPGTRTDLPDARLLLVFDADGNVNLQGISAMELEGKVWGVFIAKQSDDVVVNGKLDLGTSYNDDALGASGRSAFEQTCRYLDNNQPHRTAVLFSTPAVWVLRASGELDEDVVHVSEPFLANDPVPKDANPGMSVLQAIFSSTVRALAEAKQVLEPGSRNWLSDALKPQRTKGTDSADDASPPESDGETESLMAGEGDAVMLDTAQVAGGESVGDKLLRELDDIQPAVVGNSVVRIGRWKGEKVAAKIVLNGAEPWVKGEIRNEFRRLRALKPLQGSVVPETLFTGSINHGQDKLLVTRFVEGSRLDRASKTEKVVGGARAALRDLHNLGYIHGDVMPRNIVVKETGQCVLLDLGRTKRAKSEKDKEREMADLEVWLK